MTDGASHLREEKADRMDGRPKAADGRRRDGRSEDTLEPEPHGLWFAQKGQGYLDLSWAILLYLDCD